MKLKPEYDICFDEDDICIVRRTPEGLEEFVTPLSASAAMALEALTGGMCREDVIDAVMTEFSVADRDMVAADLDELTAQLITLGYAEA